MATNQDYYSQILTDWCVWLGKTENAYDNFSKNKEIFDFSNYSAKSKYQND